MKHKELVEIARNWLLGAKGCNPVFSERGSSKTGEMPDAIGWNSSGSIVVECKTSLVDFRTDANKPFRALPKTGMGKYRFYMMTCELFSAIPESERPEGWGFVTVSVFGSVQQVRLLTSKEFEFNMKAELYYLRNRILEIQNYGK